MSYDHQVVNNVTMDVSGGLSDSATTIPLVTGHGVRIPAVASPGFMVGTLKKLSTGELERVKITAHTAGADTMTVVRAVDNTDPLTYNAADVALSMRDGKMDWEQLPRIGLSENATVAAGTVNAATASFTLSGLQALPDNFTLTLIGAIANTSDVPTLNLTLGTGATGAKTIVKANQVPLAAGDLVPVSLLTYRSSWDQWVLNNPFYGSMQSGDYVESSRPETTRTGFVKPDGGALAIATNLALHSALTRTATVTITLASPGVVTWTAHGLIASDEITLETTGTLPTGLAVLTRYYVVEVDANSFQLSLTPGGTSINTSVSQSGVHTGRFYAYGTDGSVNFNVPDAVGRARIMAGIGTVAVSVDSNSVSASTEDFTVPTNLDTWVTGMKIQLTTSAADLPAPLAIATDYWIIRTSATTIQFATTLANAIAGTNILLSDVGSGVHTVTHTFEEDVFGESGGAQKSSSPHKHTHTQVSHNHLPRLGTSNAAANSAEVRFFNQSLVNHGVTTTGTTAVNNDTGQDVEISNRMPTIADNLWIKT